MKQHNNTNPNLDIYNINQETAPSAIKKYTVNAFTQNEISLRGLLTEKEFLNLVTLKTSFNKKDNEADKKSHLEVIIEEIIEKGAKTTFNFTLVQQKDIEDLIKTVLSKEKNFLQKHEILEYQFKNMEKWLHANSEKGIDCKNAPTFKSR